MSQPSDPSKPPTGSTSPHERSTVASPGSTPVDVQTPGEMEGPSDAHPFLPDGHESEAVRGTAVAPSFAPPIPAVPNAVPVDPRPARSTPTRPAGTLAPGEQLDDFEIIEVLGAGAFGVVYLARQVSLDREVALKITTDSSSEGRTMARLEHNHIVQVFSEQLDSENHRRLLCMQWVPGAALDEALRRLAEQGKTFWSGHDLVVMIDQLSRRPPLLDPAALRDRETLDECDHWDAVAWIGARLAEALAYAHRQGVLHRDIKPANILMSQYGRPLLADFNLAFRTVRREPHERELFGGTLPYMAPEHLDAFNPEHPSDSECVDERSDIYSLGVVLYELASGELPFHSGPPSSHSSEVLRQLAAERRTVEPAPLDRIHVEATALDRALCRCLAAEPRERFASADQLAEELEGCRSLRAVEKRLPRAGWLTRRAGAHPILWLAILSLTPHAAGSLVNITYNWLRIVGMLSAEHRAAFHRLVILYNLLAYPIGVTGLAAAMYPLIGMVRRLRSRASNPRAAASRLKVLRLPFWAAFWSVIGWFPGAAFFPIGLYWGAGPYEIRLALHLVASFVISGLIALTYSFFGAQYVALRVLYPQLWSETRQLHERATGEVRRVGDRLRAFQLLAGLIPLAGALLMVSMGDEDVAFRLLVTALILLGMLGVSISMGITRILDETLRAFGK